ncbi:hypothetical protein EDC02_1068 [Micromonospora sp. Llam0]|uniref:terpene synthase family protein n=1 Tax=Micromonospora sp. Llam0 TaxID=2485143 RepID=UPI000F4AA45A|nr:hypothetical protein EDC02_1068 [Micromonospora sp. Llam0]
MHTVSSSAAANLQSAAENGRICAVAIHGQRDLTEHTRAYPGLFPARPFDPAVSAAVSLATAFAAPWCTPEQLRLANRTALWVFAADWLIDYRATTDDEIVALVDRCRAVAYGAAAGPDDELGRFLADIVAELDQAPAFASRRDRWWAELDRTLTAMHREWRWKAARRAAPAEAGPTFADYLDNADNFGSTFVNVTHWLRLGDGPTLAHLTELITVSREVQRVLRLVNDLASIKRDTAWGDLNALLLTADRGVVEDQIGHLVDRCRDLLRPLEIRCPNQAAYLSRQLGYTSGFYRVTDFWGEL